MSAEKVDSPVPPSDCSNKKPKPERTFGTPAAVGAAIFAVAEDRLRDQRRKLTKAELSIGAVRLQGLHAEVLNLAIRLDKAKQKVESQELKRVAKMLERKIETFQKAPGDV